jgi:hypothetical protein
VPEAAVLESWGGQAVVLPYLRGHSTSEMVHTVTRRTAVTSPTHAQPEKERAR